jgi:hypothetical protein
MKIVYPDWCLCMANDTLRRDEMSTMELDDTFREDAIICLFHSSITQLDIIDYVGTSRSCYQCTAAMVKFCCNLYFFTCT